MNLSTNMQFIPHSEHAVDFCDTQVLTLANTEDPRNLELHGIQRIDLNFPKFTDGRAYSQAYLLRKRLRFHGEIRATGDVLIDQLLQLKRSGFDVAVLRSDQNPALAQRQLERYIGFYQGDALGSKPRFHERPAA
ncbi:MAG: DUF934 domain-containing protein [Rhodoferax sp.]|nr:DUF934 domain-containing protein [Rhodoferax sp.]